jgi:hypothetical protein
MSNSFTSRARHRVMLRARPPARARLWHRCGSASPRSGCCLRTSPNRTGSAGSRGADERRGGTARRLHLSRISGARNSVVAVTGEATRLPRTRVLINRVCGTSYSMSAAMPDSDQGPQRSEMTRWARKRHFEYFDLGYSTISSACASSIGGTSSNSRR